MQADIYGDIMRGDSKTASCGQGRPNERRAKNKKETLRENKAERSQEGRAGKRAIPSKLRRLEKNMRGDDKTTGRGQGGPNERRAKKQDRNPKGKQSREKPRKLSGKETHSTQATEA